MMCSFDTQCVSFTQASDVVRTSPDEEEEEEEERDDKKKTTMKKTMKLQNWMKLQS